MINIQPAPPRSISRPVIGTTAAAAALAPALFPPIFGFNKCVGNIEISRANISWQPRFGRAGNVKKNRGNMERAARGVNKRWSSWGSWQRIGLGIRIIASELSGSVSGSGYPQSLSLGQRGGKWIILGTRTISISIWGSISTATLSHVSATE